MLNINRRHYEHVVEHFPTTARMHLYYGGALFAWHIKNDRLKHAYAE